MLINEVQNCPLHNYESQDRDKIAGMSYTLMCKCTTGKGNVSKINKLAKIYGRVAKYTITPALFCRALTRSQRSILVLGLRFVTNVSTDMYPGVLPIIYRRPDNKDRLTSVLQCKRLLAVLHCVHRSRDGCTDEDRPLGMRYWSTEVD